MDGVRDRLLATFDACHSDAFRLAALLTDDAALATRAVVDAFTDLAQELASGDWAVSPRSRLLHHVLRRAEPQGDGSGPLEGLEPADQLVALVRALPNQQRRAVVLHCGLGLDGPELASALDLPTSQAVSQLRRGIASVAARRESGR
jgi:DNA-directed RNA polymerase specialized sigma24 family protein